MSYSQESLRHHTRRSHQQQAGHAALTRVGAAGAASANMPE